MVAKRACTRRVCVELFVVCRQVSVRQRVYFNFVPRLVLQVELRNRRFEEHSALIGHASFLRRNKKPRSLSFNDTNGRAEPSASVEAAAAGRRQTEELCKPLPLDLPTVVTPGVAKNQGIDAEEAFRAVGLTTNRRFVPETKAREQAGSSDGSVPPPVEASPFSPPHLFWKAVVLAPSRTRGNVGAWLEAKFGGGGAGGAGGLSRYRQDLASHGLCPELDEECLSGSGVDDDKEVACGSSGSAKLIYQALRYVGKMGREGRSQIAARCATRFDTLFWRV